MKISSYATLLLQKTYIITFLANRKNLNKIFASIKKPSKAKIVVRISFAVSSYRSFMYCSRDSSAAKLLLGASLSISASRHQTMNCVCEHLCFISIYLVQLIARCVLRFLKSLRAPEGVMLNIYAFVGDILGLQTFKIFSI